MGSDAVTHLSLMAQYAGWPTPQANNAERGGSLQRATNPDRSSDLHDFVLMASWPTPRREDSESTGAHRGVPDTLHSATQLAGWPTPSSAVIEAKSTPPIIGNRKPTDPQIGLADVAVHLAGWATPMAGTPAQNGNNAAGNNDYSRSVVALTSWVTPSARDWKDLPGMATETADRSRLDQLPRQAQFSGPARRTATGEMLTGSSAGMESGGQLNPAHSRWLMGLPVEWDACAPTATRSSRKSRPK
jgi:hypothetical protein